MADRIRAVLAAIERGAIDATGVQCRPAAGRGGGVDDADRIRHAPVRPVAQECPKTGANMVEKTAQTRPSHRSDLDVLDAVEQ